MSGENSPCKHSTLYSPYTCELCLAVAAERERCAKLAEAAIKPENCEDDELAFGWDKACREIAKRIRES